MPIIIMTNVRCSMCGVVYESAFMKFHLEKCTGLEEMDRDDIKKKAQRKNICV